MPKGIKCLNPLIFIGLFKEGNFKEGEIVTFFAPIEVFLIIPKESPGQELDLPSILYNPKIISRPLSYRKTSGAWLPYSFDLINDCRTILKSKHDSFKDEYNKGPLYLLPSSMTSF